MPARLTRRAGRALAAFGLGLGLVAVTGAASPPPAAAQPSPPPCRTCTTNVAPVSEGFLANVRSEMTELNSASSAANPTPCTTNVLVDGVSTEHQGYLRWRTTALGEEGHDAFGGTPTGTWYRQECFVPGVHDPNGFGELIQLREFPNISPQALAQVAIDEALARIGTHTLVVSPPDGNALVGLETWFWATGAPEQVTGDASVPGISVIVTAVPGDLIVDPGDGSGEFSCTGLGVPWSAGATSDCTATYEAAGTYTATARLNWTGSYTVSGGAAVPITVPVGRVDTHTVPVAEAQALNDD